MLQEIEETDNEIDQMVYELYGISDTAARTELKKLIELEVIERKSDGRNIHYVLQ